jgi:hypothetical protein
MLSIAMTPETYLAALECLYERRGSVSLSILVILRFRQLNFDETKRSVIYIFHTLCTWHPPSFNNYQNTAFYLL